ncbi:MAG: hypothetical protein R3F61_11190 [Myxococcota bacterium]
MTGLPARALLQAVPDTYVHATVGFLASGEPIDLALARVQHAAVVAGMEWLGFTPTVLGVDGAGPDAVFVEDPVVVHGSRVAFLQSAHPVRALEGPRLAPVFEAWGLERVDMGGEARMDGGDVMIVGDRAFVGLSSRTNRAGAAALGALLGLSVEVVELPDDVLHLKCATSPLGDGRILATAALAERIGLPAVIVPDAESYAANCVAHEGRVLCAAGFPRTADALLRAGFEVRALELSEIRKGDGSITCLSVRATTPA